MQVTVAPEDDTVTFVSSRGTVAPRSSTVNAGVARQAHAASSATVYSPYGRLMVLLPPIDPSLWRAHVMSTVRVSSPMMPVPLDVDAPVTDSANVRPLAVPLAQTFFNVSEPVNVNEAMPSTSVVSRPMLAAEASTLLYSATATSCCGVVSNVPPVP